MQSLCRRGHAGFRPIRRSRLRGEKVRVRGCGFAALGQKEQRFEPRLLEMMVSSQRFSYSHILHDYEGYAIRERPFLVGPTGVKLYPFLKQFLVGRHYLESRALIQII